MTTVRIWVLENGALKLEGYPITIERSLGMCQYALCVEGRVTWFDTLTMAKNSGEESAAEIDAFTPPSEALKTSELVNKLLKILNYTPSPRTGGEWYNPLNKGSLMDALISHLQNNDWDLDTAEAENDVRAFLAKMVKEAPELVA